MVFTAIEPRKPTYNVGFWEHVYSMEVKKFLQLIEQKATFLKKLESTDLMTIPEREAKSTLQKIKCLGQELNVCYGYKLMVDDLKDCYLDSSVKIYNTYHYQNLFLEAENYELKLILPEGYSESSAYFELHRRVRRRIESYKTGDRHV